MIIIRTKTKTNKQKRLKAYNNKRGRKISFEKKIVIQAIISALLFAYCMIISGTETAILQKEYIHKTVNISDTKNDVKNMFITIFDISKKGISTIGNTLAGLTYTFDSGFGSTGGNTAMASPAIYPPVPEELKSKTEPAPEQTAQESIIKAQPQFRMPLDGHITSPYGNRLHPVGNTSSTHYGIDIAGNHGDCVISALPGTIEETGFDNGLGNYVKVRHSDELLTVYGHLSEILVRRNEIVDENTRIGSVGSTGVATGPHLHFEVRLNGKCVDPAEYLP